MAKFYTFTTMFKQLKDELRYYLKDNNIYYELSSWFNDGWHFSIYVTEEEANKVNNWLDGLPYLLGEVK